MVLVCACWWFPGVVKPSAELQGQKTQRDDQASPGENLDRLSEVSPLTNRVS